GRPGRSGRKSPLLYRSIRTAHRHVAAARRPLHGRAPRPQSPAVRRRYRYLSRRMGFDARIETKLSLTARLSTVTVNLARQHDIASVPSERALPSRLRVYFAVRKRDRKAVRPLRARIT